MSLKAINIFYKLFFFSFFGLLYLYENLEASESFDYYNYISQMKSFSASFRQYTYNENGSLEEDSAGKIIYKKNSKYILEYIKPNKIKFVSDGKFITTFDEELQQVIIQSLDSIQHINIVDILTKEEFVKSKFNLSINKNGSDIYIKFTSLNKINDLDIKIFMLLINNNKIKKITFKNDFDQNVIMDFDNFKMNVAILDSLFKIKIPKNFDVIVDK